MGKYFVTGRPGVGKTTTIQTLQARGFLAYDTDSMAGLTQLEDKQTGKIVDWPNGPVDWSKYAWNWRTDKLKELLHTNKDVFVGAVVGNQEQFYKLFDKVFFLALSDRNEYRRRLNNHEHVREQTEIEHILTVHDQKQQDFLHPNMIVINASRSSDQIASDILSHINERK